MIGPSVFALSLLCAFDNPVRNGGFEERGSRKDPVPGWTAGIGATNGASSPKSELELDRKTKKSGRASLHLSGDESTRAWQLLEQDLPVRPGGEYRLTAQVKTKGVRPNGFGLNNCYVGIFFFGAEDDVVGRQLLWPDRPDQDWRRMELNVTAPSTARGAKLYVFLSMIGDLWVDDVELDLHGGEELAQLERVYFEDFSKTRRVPSKWTRDVGATNGAGGKDSRVSIDREAGALKLAGDGGTRKWWIVGPELKAAPGELYCFSARVKARDVHREGIQFQNLHLSLAFFDERKRQIGSPRFTSLASGTYDWTDAVVEAVSPEGTRSVRARVFLSMSGEVWFDDLEIRRLEDVPLPYGDWKTIEAEGVVLRFAPDHPQAGTMEPYAGRLARAKTRICRALEVEFPDTITVFVYKDLEEGRRLTGGTLDFADPRGRMVHQRRNSYIAHEMVHVIAHTTLGDSGTSLLGEGLAVWLNGQDGADHHRKARGLLEGGELPAMDDLLRRFRDQEAGYPAAGSFCGYLIETYGLAAFEELYPLGDPSARAEQLVGRSFLEMEPDWHAFLDAYR